MWFSYRHQWHLNSVDTKMGQIIWALDDWCRVVYQMAMFQVVSSWWSTSCAAETPCAWASILSARCCVRLWRACGVVRCVLLELSTTDSDIGIGLDIARLQECFQFSFLFGSKALENYLFLWQNCNKSICIGGRRWVGRIRVGRIFHIAT